MPTRRAFLGGAAAVLGTHGLAAFAANDAVLGLRAEPAKLLFDPGAAPTPVLRLAGQDPPVGLRLARGQAMAVQLQNASSEPIAFAWRGLRGVGSSAQPTVPLASGQAGSLPVTPLDSGTALLRAAPSRTHATERGAAAVVVVPDTGVNDADLDMVVLLQDWLLAADNSLRFGSTPPADAVRSAVTVNGAPQPQAVTVPPRARLRLRFVNASAQRLMVVACAGARPLIAAIDGQPSELFAPARNTVPIGPGARYDLLIDMPETADAPVRFILEPAVTLAGMLEPERDLLVITTKGTPVAPKPPRVPLPPNPALPVEIPLEAARRVDLTFAGTPGTSASPPNGWTVNGVAGLANSRPVLTARRGDTVVLGLANASDTLVPLRIAGQAVRLLHAKDDGWEPYWRDTLLLPPRTRNHVAFVADTEGDWPIDSGFDDLTLAGLGCSFRVTAR